MFLLLDGRFGIEAHTKHKKNIEIPSLQCFPGGCCKKRSIRMFYHKLASKRRFVFLGGGRGLQAKVTTFRFWSQVNFELLSVLFCGAWQVLTFMSFLFSLGVWSPMSHPWPDSADFRAVPMSLSLSLTHVSLFPLFSGPTRGKVEAINRAQSQTLAACCRFSSSCSEHSIWGSVCVCVCVRACVWRPIPSG